MKLFKYIYICTLCINKIYLLYIFTYSIYHFFPSNTRYVCNLFFNSYNAVGFFRISDHVKQSEGKTPLGAIQSGKHFLP